MTEQNQINEELKTLESDMTRFKLLLGEVLASNQALLAHACLMASHLSPGGPSNTEETKAWARISNLAQQVRSMIETEVKIKERIADIIEMVGVQ